MLTGALNVRIWMKSGGEHAERWIGRRQENESEDNDVIMEGLVMTKVHQSETYKITGAPLPVSDNPGLGSHRQCWR